MAEARAVGRTTYLFLFLHMSSRFTHPFLLSIPPFVEDAGAWRDKQKEYH